MKKLMLVIDNSMEQQFLEKFTRRLGFHTVAVNKGQKVAEQLKDFFPDLVFASMIGKHSKALNSLAKIRESRGIPKVVFVRPENDSSPLTPDQKKIVDGLLYSPIDPFKLIDILASTLDLSGNDLREKFKSFSQKESNLPPASEPEKPQGRVLLFDSERKKKYDEILENIGAANDDHAEFDTNRFKELQMEQAAKADDDPELAALKKNFIRTLFTATPKKS